MRRVILAAILTILPTVTMAQPNAFTALRDCMVDKDQDDGISDAATIARALVASCSKEFAETWRNVGIPYDWNTTTTLGLDRRDLDYATQFVLTQRETLRIIQQCLDRAFQIASAMQTQTTVTAELLNEQLRRLELLRKAVLDNPRSCPLHLIRDGK